MFVAISPDLFNQPSFEGSDYESKFDEARLTGQLKKIVACMKDGNWRTLGEIETITLAPQSSISAQLRHLRKPAFGSNTLNKRARGNRKSGLFEYQLILTNP
jgi:hypothetical protein